jgi:hypothetical protein
MRLTPKEEIILYNSNEAPAPTNAIAFLDLKRSTMLSKANRLPAMGSLSLIEVIADSRSFP